MFLANQICSCVICVLASDVASGASWMEWGKTSGGIALAIAFVLLCVVAWLTNLVALPGNWGCVLLMACYAWLLPDQGRVSIGYVAVLVAFGFALVGEMIEFFAGAAGAKRAGASRKSTLYSIIGSMAGALMGAFVGIPIPVVGSVIAAIVFGGFGAAAGAMYGEWSDGRDWRENWVVGHSTFWGRTFGTLGKLLAGFVIVLIAAIAVVL